MSKLNLSEAAAEILAASKKSAGAESFGPGNPKASDERKVKAPQQAELKIGTAGHKYTDANFDATKGMGPKATLPTGSGVTGEPMKKMSGQPQQTMGRADLTKDTETEPETSDEAKRDRKKGQLAPQKFSANLGAKPVTVPEAEEEEEWEEPEESDDEAEEVYEASIEEVIDDLEEMDDEVFEETYQSTKEDVIDYINQNFEIEESRSLFKPPSKEKGKFKREVIKDIRKLPKKDLDDINKGFPSKEGGWDKKKIKSQVNKYLKRTEESYTFKEDIDAMLAGENLSEEFKTKATMIFEAAVEARVEELGKALEEQFSTEYDKAVEVIKEDFAEKLDSYLDYVVENWMEENQLAVERGLRTEITEDFIEALRNVFVEHYIDIPDEKTDIVEQLVDKVEELEEAVNTQLLKNIELKKSISEHKKEEIVNSICEGLSVTQAEKIKSLVKSVEFISEEDFSEKVESIRESYYNNNIITASIDSLNTVVELDEDENSTKVVNPLIDLYAKNISKVKF